MKPGLAASATLGALALWGSFADAELTGIVVDERGNVAEGSAYGLVGSYERLRGRLEFAVDPDAAANAIVRDLAHGPRGRDGRVEFAADFYLLKPTDMARANGALLFEVSNRGRKGILPMLSRAAGSLDPTTSAELGDGFLLEEGYTLLWVGWQFDPADDDADLLRAYPPAARGVRGPVRSDFVVRAPARSQSLGDRGHQPYPAADVDAPGYTLTVRNAPMAERREIPRADWRFAREVDGRPVPDPGHVYLEDGFEPHLIYELVYESENPPIAGLGLAAIRDAIAALKFDGADALGIDATALDRSIAFGISQSGRVLRTFLYDGFNSDERGRKVFDGVMPHIAGGARGGFNHRFAQASRASWSFFYPNAQFPFADVTLTDPVTGRTDGLLAGLPETSMPKIVYTNSSNEYWRGTAALTHVDPTGRIDIELPDNVRIYHLAGTQHVPGAYPPTRGESAEPRNPNAYGWHLRALLTALDGWIAEDRAPPPSRYPKLADGTLVPREGLAFPRLPGLRVPARLRGARDVDFGPRFATEGIVDREPPDVGAGYPILLPQVDADGNEVAGLRSPELSVPLATFTGWSLYDPSQGPADELVSLQGSYVAFAATAAERGDDPRPAVLERYAHWAHYVGLVAEETLAQIDAGYLRPEDMAAILGNAGDRWEDAVGRARVSTR